MYVALTQQELVIADGIQYEAALTSGGVGSLLTDLPHVPNIAYKTLRYPGHYSYAQDIVAKHNGDFESIKAEFLSTFPYNDDDVIVVYAEAKGRNEQGNRVRKTFSRRYVGHGGLSGIQCTTAGAGVAMLEMMLIGTVKSGIIKHKDVSLEQFCQTRAVKQAYREA
jgi:saccharopine dehydrogenase-like NADP-dependent oxidoreductase